MPCGATHQPLVSGVHPGPRKLPPQRHCLFSSDMGAFRSRSDLEPDVKRQGTTHKGHPPRPRPQTHRTSPTRHRLLHFSDSTLVFGTRLVHHAQILPERTEDADMNGKRVRFNCKLVSPGSPIGFRQRLPWPPTCCMSGQEIHDPQWYYFMHHTRNDNRQCVNRSFMLIRFVHPCNANSAPRALDDPGTQLQRSKPAALMECSHTVRHLVESSTRICPSPSQSGSSKWNSITTCASCAAIEIL